jgi:hypothetical protein
MAREPGRSGANRGGGEREKNIEKSWRRIVKFHGAAICRPAQGQRAGLGALFFPAGS